MERHISDYLDYGRRRGLKEGTLKGHRRIVTAFIRYVGDEHPDITDITEISRDVVLAYEKRLAVKRDASGRPHSIAWRRRHLAGLRDFFAWLTREERIYRNPAIRLAIPPKRERTISDVLTVEEMALLLKSCSGHSMKSLRDRAVLELLYSTGVRADELCRVDIADLDLNERVLFVRHGKLGNRRYVPFGESARYWVGRYIEKARPLVETDEKEALFVSNWGRRLGPTVLGRIIKKWAEIAGIGKRVTCHTFRHSCATHMLKGGADIRYVQKQLGHRSIRSTERYLKIEITDLKEVHGRCHPLERDE